MKYNSINETGNSTYHDTYDYYQNDVVLSDREKLDSIDDKVIESYLREKKLKILNKK